jgi:hypothetical protein
MSRFRLRLKRFYVAAMMRIVGWGLRAMSRVDPVVREEAAGFPDGMVIEMTTMPDGPGLVLQKSPDGHLRYLGGRCPSAPTSPSASSTWIILSACSRSSRARPPPSPAPGWSSTAISRPAIRLVRCMYRLEALLMPRFIAARGMKRYPGRSRARLQARHERKNLRPHRARSRNEELT